MNFREAEEYLFSLGNEVTAMKLGLDAMRVLLAEIGDPQKKYLKVQVAGTNGKGSVCAFLDSICNTAGIKTGTFTSPHLVSITERVRINGVDISKNEFARFAGVVRAASEKLVADGRLESTPTFFEQVTGIALVAFADAGVELAILETGLGGRLDATTAADAEIAVITRIDLDHQQFLGDTIEEIAAEKAAIIHEGSIAVIGAQAAEAEAVLRKRCAAIQAHCREAHSLPAVFPPEELGIIGRHQIENAALALSAAALLQGKFQITDDHLFAGLRAARHPGRLEYQGRYLFDGAHNVGAAIALGSFLGPIVIKERRPVTVIFGAMEDKESFDMMAIIFPWATRVVLTTPHNSRSTSAIALANDLPDTIPVGKVTVTETVREALAAAAEMTPEDGIILVTGSLYLVGDVKKLLKENLKSEI